MFTWIAGIAMLFSWYVTGSNQIAEQEAAAAKATGSQAETAVQDTTAEPAAEPVAEQEAVTVHESTTDRYLHGCPLYGDTIVDKDAYGSVSHWVCDLGPDGLMRWHHDYDADARHIRERARKNRPRRFSRHLLPRRTRWKATPARAAMRRAVRLGRPARPHGKRPRKLPGSFGV
ncbi:hypothetical protein D477_003138 [Arthrobacter crystallopoietes BAB-32]|uniref:Uncharacterized protein n=1 Tax=Arthrobacter crystallopoietes BAB-32 TaxID=1246476 RepID=N1UZ28_9MICC|nr:hypothetical protein [Arthrobacter crystallopoietes]EMY35656.1 hypothetical protein D477_003138 [Arthrobacter crystallopoietes BAB-32]